MRILAPYNALAIICTLTSIMANANEEERILTMRAVSEPSPKLTQLINKIAEPINVRVEPGDTLRQAIIRQCGGVSEAYVDIQEQTTGLSSQNLDEPLDKHTVTLPACLYYSKPPEVPQITIRTGDIAYNLYRTRTGGAGTQMELVSYFNEPIEALSSLKPGDKLQAPAVSLPVPLLVRSGSEFLIEEVRKLDPQGSEVIELPKVEGEIVMGISSGEIATRGDCESPSAPMNAEAIYKAYMFSKELAKSDDINVTGGRARLAIVDNGFFGARVISPVSKAFDGSPFRRNYFKADSTYTVAQTFTLGRILQPINYTYGLQPTLESGHGTHVAGIALGGPSLAPYFDKMSSEPWASVAIVNIGLGARSLVKGAHELLLSQLRDSNRYRIVNLSITHDSLVDKNVRDNYQVLFSSAANTLFVVAAGNNWGAEVEDRGVIPAALGGTKSSNVITVAAIDGKHKIAKFSNVGSNAVDMAAPGCDIKSWISNSPDIVLMSGTSQATPAVTNEIALQLSLAINATARTLKNRTISSGDLLPESERGKTVYEVSANPERSLLMFQDYLEVEDGSVQRILLGSAINMAPVNCTFKNGKSWKKIENLFSLKRTENKSYFFGGKNIGNIQPPCLITDNVKATLFFSATHEILPTGDIVKLPALLEKSWPLTNITNFVARTPLDEIL